MSAARHLVTGATGLVGGAVVLELLQETDDTVTCLVRAGNRSAQSRMRDALVEAAEAYDRLHLIPLIDSRCQALAGDIVARLCGVDPDAVRDVDVVWHCAASLRFEDRFAEEIHEINVTGTRHVLELARTMRAARINYVSTAYVAGTRTGRILEAPASDLSLANNEYERSKVLAELEVTRSQMPWRILRPSIVIGHSVTHAATTFSGVYGFASAVLLFQQSVHRRFGHVLAHRRVPVRVQDDVQLNLIPVDLVAANAVRIGLSDAPQRVFHLTNSAPISAADTVAEVFGQIGLREPQMVFDTRRLTAVDAVLDEGIDFYRQYLRSAKVFDRTNADAVCGAQASRVELDRAILGRYLRWYLDRIGSDGRAASPARPAHAYRAGRSGSLVPA